MTNTYNKNGFSILETMLTTIVVAGILLAIFNIFEDYAEKTLAKSTAKFLDNISDAVEEILDNQDYFVLVYTMADAQPNDVLELTLDNLINGFGFPPNDVPPSSVLNANMRQQTPLKTGVNIMVRIADNPAITTDSNALEIIITSDEPVIDSRARKAAFELGPYGGYYRDEVEGIKSAFASWRLDVSNFNNSNWGDIINATPPSLSSGTYIVHYKYKTFEDVVGDYLYRDRVPSAPELNQMFTTLNMGGNNILGSDNLDISSNLLLDSNAVVKGSIRAGSAVFNNSNFFAENKFTTQNAIIKGNGTGVRGNFAVEDVLSITNLSANGTVSSNNVIFENGVNTTGDLRTNGLIQFDQGATADKIHATALTGDHDFNINVNETLNASAVQIDSLTMDGTGRVGTIDLRSSGNISVTGNINAQNMGFGDLTVITFGACDNGC